LQAIGRTLAAVVKGAATDKVTIPYAFGAGLFSRPRKMGDLVGMRLR